MNQENMSLSASAEDSFESEANNLSVPRLNGLESVPKALQPAAKAAFAGLLAMLSVKDANSAVLANLDVSSNIGSAFSGLGLASGGVPSGGYEELQYTVSFSQAGEITHLDFIDNQNPVIATGWSASIFGGDHDLDTDITITDLGLNSEDVKAYQNGVQIGALDNFVQNPSQATDSIQSVSADTPFSFVAGDVTFIFNRQEGLQTSYNIDSSNFLSGTPTTGPNASAGVDNFSMTGIGGPVPSNFTFVPNFEVHGNVIPEPSPALLAALGLSAAAFRRKR